MSDIFDTRFENTKIEVGDNKATLGDDINISALDPTLKNVLVGVGWDLNAFDADALDLDISLFMLDRNHMTRMDEDFVFYNQPEAFDGGVKHNGDSRTGAGDGDDESIAINLEAVPYDIFHLYFALTIYKGYEKKQSLSQVRNAYIRIVNTDTGHEIMRYDIDEDLQDKEETAAVIIAALNREGPKWHFKPMNEVAPGGLGELAKRYDLIIGQE